MSPPLVHGLALSPTVFHCCCFPSSLPLSLFSSQHREEKLMDVPTLKIWDRKEQWKSTCALIYRKQNINQRTSFSKLLLDTRLYSYLPVHCVSHWCWVSQVKRLDVLPVHQHLSPLMSSGLWRTVWSWGDEKESCVPQWPLLYRTHKGIGRPNRHTGHCLSRALAHRLRGQ